MSAAAIRWKPTHRRRAAPADRSANRGARRGPESAREAVSSVWLFGFVFFQMACQIGLLFESLGSLRVVVRGAAFAASLVLLLALWGKKRPHPSQPWALLAVIILGLELFHPRTNSTQAGIAHFAMHLAIVAPLFWGPRLTVTPQTFRRLVLCMWAFHTASAGFGVLQTHYPGRFQPNVSSKIMGMGVMADAYKIELANGQSVWRPTGLTDVPGGAASAGLYAVLFGIGIFLDSRSRYLLLPSAASLALGLFCLYISQVRSLLVMAGVCALSLIAVLGIRGDRRRLGNAVIILPIVVVVTFLWATSIGGNATVRRLSTLVEDDVSSVYARNRGHFLVETVTYLLPEYPFGAGLARWGMMRSYFGDESNADSPPIYVEIQWTGWLLDGGVPLIVAACAAIAVACLTTLRIAFARLSEGMPLWGAMVFALNVGTIGVTFNYPIFMSQGGMEFWFLNAVLYGAAVQSAAAARAKSREAGLGDRARPNSRSGPRKMPLMAGGGS
jgi:hypothetical protein